MIQKDSDSLECDLAETYHIYDMRSLSASRVALFACGLGEDSRIKKRLSESRIGQTDMLLAGILDGITTLVWMLSKKGTPHPGSVLDRLSHPEKYQAEESKPVQAFDSPEDFEKARRKIIGEEG